MIAGQLANGDITSYVQAASGRRTMTISGANGYVYIQKSITIRPGASMTVAIINTASGLDLKEISDASLQRTIRFRLPQDPQSVPESGTL